MVDEAYVEFSGAASLSRAWIGTPIWSCCARSPRPMHWPARAAARCSGDPDLVDLLRRMIAPYALPAPTIEAALQRSTRRSVPTRSSAASSRRERARVAMAGAAAGDPQGLAKRGKLSACRVPRCRARLSSRAGGAAPDSRSPLTAGLGSSLRITIGTPEQNDRLIRGAGGRMSAAAACCSSIATARWSRNRPINRWTDRQDSSACRASSPRCSDPARRRFQVRHGHQPGRSRHRGFPRATSAARRSFCCNCSPRRV